MNAYGDCSSADRAPGFYPDSRRFESSQSHQQMTNEQLWVLVKHYERLIALLLEQLDDDERKDTGHC